MTNYDHDAIRKAYPNVFMIDDDTDTIVDANGDAVTIDQSLVDTARAELDGVIYQHHRVCLLYTSPSPRDVEESRMPSSA